MKIAFFDCFSGAAGDMIIGALLHAGADFDHLYTALMGLNLSEVEDIKVIPVTRAGIAAYHFQPIVNLQAAQTHRHLTDILQIIENAELSEKVKSNAAAIFLNLAAAEGHVHNIPPEKVHFHEVGAADAILDIVGACIALEWLGIDEIHCSPLATGNGIVTCEHGIMPVPAPATAELIKGIPLMSTDIQRELLTPTGAAIFTTLAHSFGPLPDFSMNAIGYGSGTRELKNRPNVVRVLIGETGPANSNADLVYELSVNLDDMTPEKTGFLMEKLLQNGALDVFFIPIYMKKNRPAVCISLLCEPGDKTHLEKLIFQESTTFGIRSHLCQRTKLQRESQTLDTPYGPIRIKTGWLDGRPITFSPEFDDCKLAAEKHNVPLRLIYEHIQRLKSEPSK